MGAVALRAVVVGLCLCACTERPSAIEMDASSPPGSSGGGSRSGGGAATSADAGDAACCAPTDAGRDSGAYTPFDYPRQRGPWHELDAGGDVALPFVRVAFIGDQALTAGAREVLSMIGSEGADLVVHAGDFDYLDMPQAFEHQIDAVLGDGVPYIAAVGNHDVPAWDGPGGYRARLLARAARHPALDCWGDYGVNGACRFHGVLLVISGVGTLGEGHVPFIEGTLADSTAAARVCVWHKNQRDMQVGFKVDEVGWGAYRACQTGGALVVTGHEHAYARTFTLTAVGNVGLQHGAGGIPDILDLRVGRTAVVVSALAGHSTRNFNAALVDNSWWASIYTGGRQVVSGLLVSQDAQTTFGALFIDFVLASDGGEATGEAYGYFRLIDGSTVDRFELRFR